MSMRNIAGKAGCSPMASYRHFPSKEALLAEIACEGFSELRREIDECVADFPEDPIRQLEEVGHRYIRLSLSKPEHLLTMFGAVIKDHQAYASLDKRAESAFHGLVDIVARGQELGQFPEGDPVAKAVACWSIVHGFSMLLINGNLNWLGISLKNSEEFAAFVARSIVHGIRNT
jgi:AcrR family transcriptional regulator